MRMKSTLLGGKIIGSLTALLCLSIPLYKYKSTGAFTNFNLYLFFLPALLALVGSVLGNRILLILSILWLLPSAIYLNFGIIYIMTLAISTFWFGIKQNNKNEINEVISKDKNNNR